MSVVTLRYAHAFADVARSNALDPGVAQQQLSDFAGTLRGSPELQEFLGNPSIPLEDKLKIVDVVVGRIGVYPEVRNLIAVMVRNERLGDMESVVTDYGAVVDEQTSVSEAAVTSARALNEADRAELEQSIAKIVGGRVNTSFHEDATLLGGAVVRIGSTIYDGSVRAQLQQLKRKLISA